MSSCSIIKSIEDQNWDQLKIEIQKDENVVRKSMVVSGFLGSEVDCMVTTMHQACSNNPPVSIVEALHEIDPRLLLTRDSAYKRLPLHVSLIASASEEVILKLIALVPTAAQGQDILGRLPLHYACNHGVDIQVVEHLVDAYPHAVMMVDENGWLPLHVACRFGMSLEVIQLLLNKFPISIQMTTSKGTTPLRLAQCNNHKHLIHFLQSTMSSTIRRRSGTDSIYQWTSRVQLDLVDFVDLEHSVDDTLGSTDIYEQIWCVGSMSSDISSLTDLDSPLPLYASGQRGKIRGLLFKFKSLFYPRVVS